MAATNCYFDFIWSFKVRKLWRMLISVLQSQWMNDLFTVRGKKLENIHIKQADITKFRLKDDLKQLTDHQNRWIF